MSGQASEGDAPVELSNMVAISSVEPISSMELHLRELGEVIIDGAAADGGLWPDAPAAVGSSLSSLRSAGALSGLYEWWSKAFSGAGLPKSV